MPLKIMNVSEPIFWVVLAVLISQFMQWSRSGKYVSLPRDRFWALVGSQEKPIVLLATRGFFIKRLCYVFPYQGVLFYADAREAEAPEGVTLIGAGNSFSLP